MARTAVGVLFSFAGVYGASLVGREAAAAAVMGLLLVIGTVWIWLPRGAHRAFIRGDYRRGQLLYRILRGCRWDTRTRGALDVSLAACALGRQDYEYAVGRLQQVRPESLDGAAKASWLNNRAYTLVRYDAVSSDPDEALRLSSQALALRPSVAGFRHTYGLALLGQRRLDEAIRVFDGLWGAPGQYAISPLLEAERCFDLGVAWTLKGEADYATDYFERAQRAAPQSCWSAQAIKHLRAPRFDATIEEYIDS